MEEKFTASQYAQMSGGHTVETSVPNNFGFIKDLNESKLYRTKQQLQGTDIRDLLDFVHVNMLTLHILYNNYETAAIAQDYAKRTLQAGGGQFKTYRQSGTDLYQALHAINTGKYRVSDNAAIQAGKVKIPEFKIKNYLTQIAQGRKQFGHQAFFMQLEKSLDIQNTGLRSLRRLAADWTNIDTVQRSLVSTRILQYYRTNAIKSELYAPFKDWSKKAGLQLRNVRNAERGSRVGQLAKKAAIGTASFAGGFAAGRAFGRSLV